MKHYFIVNPAAGQTDSFKILTEKLKTIAADFEIYSTKEKGDCIRFIKERCEEFSYERLRFYACGGDGTINEVINGAFGYENVEVSCYPCGSGNDFIKYYGEKERFLDVEELINASAAPIDLIKVGERLSVNVVNFGFDTYACKTMNEIKKKPVIGGSNAYYSGVIKALLFAMKSKAKVYADGELLNEGGEFLLCSAANGKYYGGSFCCAPRSDNTDGLMEVCLIKLISRLRFLTLVKAYEKGEHLDNRRFGDILVYRRAKKLEINASDSFTITLDGEIIEGKDFTCEIIPKGINFAVPTFKAK